MAGEQQDRIPEKSGKASVFVSYSRGDLDRARPVIGLLEEAGLTVWWDGLLEGGENYLPTTEAALEGADCVVALWSKTSVESHWVRDEAQSGRERRCLVPVSIDGTIPPLGFRQFQVIDASSWNGDPSAPVAEQILRAVQAQCRLPSAPRKESHLAAASPRVSRRVLIGSGVGLAALAGVGAWQLGLFSEPALATSSVAVLPFENLTGDPAQQWFSDGLSSELRTVLARNPRLQVAAPTSSKSAGEGDADGVSAARQLGVAYILRGGVQRVADTVRISAEVLRAKDSVVVWADSLDRKLEDIFSVQSEIAETVAMALVIEVASADEARRSIDEQSPIGGTNSVAAFEAYLKGHALFDLSAGNESDRQALEQFESAIAEDPDYASAHAMRATMLAAVANTTDKPGEIRLLYDASISAAKRAIALEPRLAQGHLALGYALANGKLDAGQARPHYFKARDLAGGNADIIRAVATFLAYGEDIPGATSMIAKVLELDPLNARAYRTAGYIAYARRDYPATVASMERALELNERLASAPYMIGNAQYLQGDAKAALETYRSEIVPLFAKTGEAIAHAKLGNATAADAAMESLITDYGDNALFQQAQVLAQRGKGAEALETLNRALAARDPGLLLAATDPMLDPLCDAPGFAELLSALGS